MQYKDDENDCLEFKIDIGNDFAALTERKRKVSGSKFNKSGSAKKKPSCSHEKENTLVPRAKKIKNYGLLSEFNGVASPNDLNGSELCNELLTAASYHPSQ